MSYVCSICGQLCSKKSNLMRHIKRIHEKFPICDQTKTNKMNDKVVLMVEDNNDGYMENENESTEKKKFIRQSNVGSRAESITEIDNVNKTDQLLMVLIKQNQDLKDRLERLENKPEQNQNLKKRVETLENKSKQNTLEIHNTVQINTINIYLNENTDMYKIFDEYGIEDRSKIAKLVEICNEKNKLGYLVRDPMKDYIKKNNLLYTKKKKVYMKKDDKGFVPVNLNELNTMSDRMVDSLYTGIWKHHIIPLGEKAIQYADQKEQLLADEQERIEKQRKEREEKIKRELRRKRDEDVVNGIKGAKNRDIEEEYLKLKSLGAITEEKLRMIDDEVNQNPIMDEYLDEMYNKYGNGLVNLMINRKKRSLKNIDKNVLVEEYEKTAS